MSAVAFIRRMVESGFSYEEALKAAEAFEQTVEDMLPAARTKRQERNARYYQSRRSKASEASEKRLNASESSESSDDVQKVSPTPPSKNTPPSAPKGASVPPPGEAETLARCVDAWNAVADRCGLPKAKQLTDTRRRQLRARLKAHGEPGLRQAVEAVERSAFCRGLRTARDGRAFKASFDFVLQESSFQKLIEGAYGDDAPRTKPPPRPATPEWQAHCLTHFRQTGEWLGDPAEKPKLAA